MLAEVEPVVGREPFLQALGGPRIVVRGPKPLAVLREWKVGVDVQVPEPNTWRDLLTTLDAQFPVAGLRVAVQEYGKPNPELVKALEARGAAVTVVPVYRWELPEDAGPLRSTVAQIALGSIDAVLFTSAQQVEHLLAVADEDGHGEAVRQALRERVVVGSIGPTTTEALALHGIRPGVQPEHPKMGHLVAALAERFRGGASTTIEPIDSAGSPARDPLQDSPFLRACRREPSGVTPIWLMRQAGRYQPEYRAIRARVGFLELCKTPELAAEVTIMAAHSLGVDAAILFADILLILEPLGFHLEFSKGDGPVIHDPIRAAADVDRVRLLDDLAPLDYVFDAVRLIRRGLRADVPLIGFAGAPFTLACYAIEGGGSRHYDRAKTFMYTDLGAWDALMARLVDATAAYLNAQADAGCAGPAIVR